MEIINTIICNKKPSINIKKLKTPTKTVTDNKSISETFNEYLCSIAENIKKGIPSPNHSDSSWKTNQVIAIHKSGSKCNVSNY